MSRKSLIASMSSVVVIASGVLLAIPAPAYASSSDSDRDGMSNRWEAHFHLNAHHANGGADADRDGLTNLQEFRLGTNPRVDDSDHDGIDDPFEDSDRDGIDNEDEFSNCAVTLPATAQAQFSDDDQDEEDCLAVGSAGDDEDD